MMKLLLNNLILTSKAQFITMDIKNFYLNTQLKRYEYLKLKLVNIPENAQKQYKLRGKATQDGWVYVEVR